MATRESIEAHLFGRATKSETETAVASARWIDTDRLRDAAAGKPASPFYFGAGRSPHAVFLGTLPQGDEHAWEGVPVGWHDNRHLITVAGSRAGKGQSVIIPNLHVCSGSILCLDPKGENALATAAVRSGLHAQEVFVLDPFEVCEGEVAAHVAQFNPLETIELYSGETIESVAAIADSLVIQSNDKDAHWDESARSLIEALILFVLVDPRIEDRSLMEVRKLLMSGLVRAARRSRIEEVAWVSRIWFPPQAIPDGDLPGFDTLLKAMASNQDDHYGPIISGQANALQAMGPEERGGVLSVARRNTKFIEGEAMPRTLSSGGRQLNFGDLKARPEGIAVYVVLPARYMSTHARWLRMLISCMIVAVEKSGRPADYTPPVLAILDEFPVLGYLKLVESAVGYIAGFGLRLWTIVQDLSQLKRYYPDSWETFIGNAGVRQFFGNTDDTTLSYISKQLGETEIELFSQNVSSTRTSTHNKPSKAEEARLLSTLSAAGFPNNAAFFDSHSSQEGSTQGHGSQTTRTALLTPDEVARLFSRESLNQLVLAADNQPLRLKRVDHHGLGDEAQAQHYWAQMIR